MFQYSPLGAQKDAIRLVKLQGVDQGGNISLSIQNTSLESSNFIALSYVWGSKAAACHKVVIGGRPFWVRPNLHSFLKHAASSLRNVNLWIDALCINQEDIREKNRQIPIMGKIYGKASKVIVWLHEDTNAYDRDRRDPKLLAGVLGSGVSSFFKRMSTSGKDKEIAAELRRLLNHEYWWRLWTAQETEFAHDIEVIWGQYAFKWDVLERLMWQDFCGSMDLDIDEKPIPSYMKQVQLDENHPLNARFRREQFSGRGPQKCDVALPRLPIKQGLIYLINEHHTYKCTNPLDWVYALVPLSCDMKKLKIDYSAVPEALLARVLSLDRYPPERSVEWIGKRLGINIRSLNVNIVGSSNAPSNGEIERLPEVRMCSHCLARGTWKTALKKYTFTLQGITVWSFPGTSFYFGTFVFDFLPADAMLGPLVVSTSTNAAGRRLYTVHLDKDSIERYETLIWRYTEVKRRRLDPSHDRELLDDYRPFDGYRLRSDGKDPVPDLLQEGEKGYRIQLRLADWEQLSRMIYIATRGPDLYESSACTAHETGRHRPTYASYQVGESSRREGG